MPKHWLEWLYAAIEAEDICLRFGMNSFQASNFLEKQNPITVCEFVNEFSNGHKKTMSYGSQTFFLMSMMPLTDGNRQIHRRPTQDNINSKSRTIYTIN